MLRVIGLMAFLIVSANIENNASRSQYVLNERSNCSGDWIPKQVQMSNLDENRNECTFALRKDIQTSVQTYGEVVRSVGISLETESKWEEKMRKFYILYSHFG